MNQSHQVYTDQERIEHLEKKLSDLTSLLEDILNITTCDQCGELTLKSQLCLDNTGYHECADICPRCWTENDIEQREQAEAERRAKLPPKGPIPEFGPDGKRN